MVFTRWRCGCDADIHEVALRTRRYSLGGADGSHVVALKTSLDSPDVDKDFDG